MAARSSVSTLHARLNLPASFSHSTLKRCLIDSTASPTVNNAGLAEHGNALLGYYISTYLVTRYPRLPYKVTTNALVSYAGWKTLASVGKGWGVEAMPKVREESTTRGRKTSTSVEPMLSDAEVESRLQVTRVEPGHLLQGADTARNYVDTAYADFVRSVVGALDIHGSTKDVRQFIDHHFLSREIDLVRSFRINQPERELSHLCAREGLEAPVTRLIAETGRRSNSAVFIAGVYSGMDKLGEGQGSSLKEAKYLAASNAMKSWYLFEDRSATLSSHLLEDDFTGTYKPAMVDVGNVIV